MKLIADSGSTKTTWNLIDSHDQVQSFGTIGFNPYIIGSDDILREMNLSFPKNIDPKTIHELHFYGSGASSPKMVEIVASAFRRFFENANIVVEHDLLGAARSICGREPGVACILGTGSNSCYYDGTHIKKNVRALGYILGDEGSGSYIGKQLIKDYLNLEMDQDIRDKFDKTFGIDDLEILDRVYKQAFPNTFLASFASFVSENKSNSYCRNIILNAFKDFRDKHVLKYESAKSNPINFVGSVAYHNIDLLKEVFETEVGLTIGTVIKDPIDGLLQYHRD